MANLLYKFELIIITSVYSTQCKVVNIQSEAVECGTLSGGVDCTYGSCVANLLYKFELIIINSVSPTQCRGIITSDYCTQCRAVNIQSERPNETSLSDGVNCTQSSCVANSSYTFELIIINHVFSAQCRVVHIQLETTRCDITE